MKDFTHLSDKSADALARLAPETDDGVAVTAEFEPMVPPGPPPASVGRYKVTQWLGAGGFGIVYKAIDEQLQREVAIKIVLPPKDLPTDGDTLLSEARLMARLSHPAIVPIYDVGQLKDGSVFIVSKLIEGQDLSHLLKSRRLTHRESAALVAQIADALDYAHGQGIVHRDVKPKNILISSDSSPVLADFGLALQQSDYGRGPRFAGTPAYMSPEQARLEGHRVDGRSDVYSLGTVLYELLTGTRPFEAESVDELLDCIRTVEVRPPRQLDRQIPRELERICLKALSKRPADRYSTAGDLAEDLRQWQSAVAATAANTPTVGDKPQASDSAKSDRLNVVIVPRGLRPFEAVDADFFLELLPGARDRNGLPESVRFWKSRIEEVEAEQTFRAGLLLGPSGSGKSSLVRAGIIPQLDENVLVIVVDARPEHLDERLLARLKSRIPALSSVVSLAEGLRLVRQRRVLPAERKLLLVIDQFEQWLSAHDATSREALVEALRQCDGATSQVLFLVRDDFTLAATRFMEELEEPLLQNCNFATLDLFSEAHARRVLAAFGKSFGAVADRPTAEQERFLDLAIKELATSGRVAPIQLAVFAEMMKDKPWTPGMLRNFGGILGVGVAFLEDRLAGANAHPYLKSNYSLVKQILAALLPEIDSEIKGRSQKRHELVEHLNAHKQEGVVERLLGLLDTEVRLITRASGEKGSGDSASGNREPSYQLAHDYLVPVLRDWLTADERATHAGRTRIRSRELAAAWNKQPESRRLPTALQWANIRCFTRPRIWSEGERRMMRAADRRMTTFLAAGLLVALLAVAIAREWNGRIQGAAQRDRVLAADTVELPLIARDVANYGRWALPLIRKAADEESQASNADPASDQQLRRRMNVALILGKSDPKHVDYVVEHLGQSDPRQLSAVASMLPAKAAQSRLWERFEGQAAMTDGSLLPLGAVLAQVAPSDERWESHLPAVTQQLVAARPAQISEWMALFAPLGERLAPQLLESLRAGKGKSVSQISNAIEALGRFSADKPDVLAAAIGDAPLADFSTLARALSALGSSAQTALRKQLWQLDGLPRRGAVQGDPPSSVLQALVEPYDGYLDAASGMAQSLPIKNMNAVATSLADHGYRPISIRPYAKAGELFVAVVWKRDSRRFAIEQVATAEELVEINRRKVSEGLTIVDFASYQRPGANDQELAWAGVWEVAAAGSAAPPDSKRLYLDLALIEHQRRDEEWSKAGFSIERFDMRMDDHGEARCSAVWRQTDVADPTAQYITRYLHGFGDLTPGSAQVDCRFCWLDLHRSDRWVFDEQIAKNTGDAEGTASEQTALTKWLNVIRYRIAVGDFDQAAALLEANRARFSRSAQFVEHSAQLHARRGDLEPLKADIIAYQRSTPRKIGMLDYFRLRAALLANEPIDEPLRLLKDAYGKAKDARQKAALCELLAHAEAAIAAARPANDAAARVNAIERLREFAQLGDPDPLAFVVFDCDFDELRKRLEFAKLLVDFQSHQRYCVAYGHYPGEESQQLYALSPAAHLRVSSDLRRDGFMPHCVTVQVDPVTGNPQACSVWRRTVVSPDEQRLVAKRRANLAMALAYLGDFDSAQAYLQGAAGLDCRCLIETKAAELLPPERLVRALQTASSPAEQSRLLRLLGGYPKTRFSTDDQNYLIARLATMAATAGNAAVKSAASWCLSQWQIAQPKTDAENSGKLTAGRNWFVNSLGQTMIVIPAGERFLMGSPECEPGHEVSEWRHWARIDRSFAVTATETTQGQFRDFLADERIKRLYASERRSPLLAPSAKEDRPEPVSWRDAARFCQWLTEREGLPENEWCYPGIFSASDSLTLPANYLERTGYRLPREMEWEYAARAGSVEARHCGTDDEVLSGYEWFMPQSGGRTHAVALLRPNDLGFFDTLGNVFEWCDDLQSSYRRPLDSFIHTDSKGNTRFPKETDKCVIRGGSVTLLPDKLRAANRSYQWIDYHTPTTGFRVARTERQ